MAKRLTRAEVPEPETWDLTDLFASEAAWEAEMESIAGSFAGVTQYQGRLGQGPKVLLACLEAQEELAKRFFRVVVPRSPSHRPDRELWLSATGSSERRRS